MQKNVPPPGVPSSALTRDLEFTQTLRLGADEGLYRARRHGDPVLVWVPLSLHPPMPVLRRFENAWRLADRLDSAWALRPLELRRSSTGMAMVLEPFEGQPLDGLVTAPLDVAAFLRLAIAITAAVAAMHHNQLIHKDLKAEHILVEPGTGKVKLTGFGVATLLPREHRAASHPAILEGTLTHMSPEQTGRINRSIDSRADLYSLGVTLYQLLTGRLPFMAEDPGGPTDPLEWIHCHIARMPVPPHEARPEIPEAVSGLVMKLLAKTPEERYQTAAGVEWDLQTCLDELDATGRVDPFPLGARDASDRLVVPEKLYGRDREIQSLLAAFDRVVTSGTPELILVSGYSGVGKSAVVNELHRALVVPGGIFASGKFDQYKRDIPYETFAQAFQGVIREILSASEGAVGRWREAIQAAVGPSGQLIVDLIPELELIIGKQPPIPDLPPVEAQNRFHAVFRQFLGAITTEEHPLALFLDDLQWLDPASLKLLEHLATHPDVRYLLLIGAYRDNEVGPAHPLMLTLEAIRKAGAAVTDIVLEPLSQVDIGRLVADALRADRERTAALARLVYEKTGGNPFFAIQFLTALPAEGLLEFDPRDAAWKWDVDRIRAMGFSENVVDLMVGKLRRLAPATQEVLEQVACLGHRAESSTLAMVCGGSEDQAHGDLWEAVREGLLFRLGDTYRFPHDRVQEAAYSLIPAESRAAAHLRIGRLLLAHMGQEAIEERAFDLVNQLNRGAELITDAPEREALCRLNAKAGRKAKAAIAYASARNYLIQATALLTPDAWAERYEDTFSLYLDMSECEYLAGNFPRADELFNLLLENARSSLHRARVYRLRLRLYQVAGRYDDGVAVALEALRLFGVTFPESEREIQAATEAEVGAIAGSLGGRRIADLADAPVATDPDERAIIGLLVEAEPCAYIGRPKLFPLLALRAVNSSLRHGNTAESCFAYSAYGLMLVSIFGDIPSGFEYSEMSLRLNEKFGDVRLKGTLLHLHGDHINFWRKPIATDFPILERAFLACQEVGDLVYAGFLAFETVWQAWERGDPLGQVLEFSRKFAAFAKQSHNDAVYDTIRAEQQFVACLKGLTRGPASFDDAAFDENECLAAITRATFGCGIVFFHIMKQIVAFTCGRYAEALEAAARAEPVLGAAMAMPIEATHHFYLALTLAALHPAAARDRQAELAPPLEEPLRKLRLWAENCPENYLNRHALVSAEAARIEGRDLDAMRLYEQAIGSARDNGFLQNEALAYELAAQFYRQRGYDAFADTYLREARYRYLRWGADGKVAQLDLLYPRLAPSRAPALEAPSGTPVGQVDVLTVVKASQAISREIRLDRLVKTLMRIVLESAGAEVGKLILAGDGGLALAAQARANPPEVVFFGTDSSVRDPMRYPRGVVDYVARTRKTVLLGDASTDPVLSSDPYFGESLHRSVLCLPLVSQAEPVGVLYLENSAVTGAFTEEGRGLLELLASQIAISLGNAVLYSERQRAEEAVRTLNADLERRVADRTAQLQAAFEALLHSEKRLADAQQLAQVGSWEWDVPADKLDWSAALFGIFGVEPQEFQATYPGYLARVHPDDRALVETSVARAQQDLQPFDFDHRIIRPDGDVRVLHARGEVFADENGRPVRMMGTAQDITDRRRLEDELKVQYEKLKELDTLKSRFVSAVSHELRTPLTSIRGYLEFLEDELGGPLSTEQQKFVAQIQAGTTRLERLIEELLDYARIEAGTFRLRLERGDLGAKIAEIAESFTPQLREAGLELVTDVRLGGRRLVIDEHRIGQVLINLVGNAIKFTPAGGAIRVSAFVDRDQVRCEVADTGPGIPAQEVPKLFGRFTQLEGGIRKGTGTGLGLSISKAIVEAHGGRVGVESEPGVGSTFWFELPRVRAHPART